MKKGFHQRHVHISYHIPEKCCENCAFLYLHWDPEAWLGYCNRTGIRPRNHDELIEAGFDCFLRAFDKQIEKYYTWQNTRMIKQAGSCTCWKKKESDENKTTRSNN